MQRTEVLEAEEFFSGSKGLPLPHKRNPVLTENPTGLARLVRMAVCLRWKTWRCGMSAIFRTAWERNIGPDATVTWILSIPPDQRR